MGSTKPSKAQPLFDYDRQLGRWVAGADEVGRGCLAGPLVAAAVLFDYEQIGSEQEALLDHLGDSKSKSEARREALYPLVLRCAARISIVSRSPASIDRYGLHKSNLAALQRALEQLRQPEAVHLVDGYGLPDANFDHQRIVKGDSTSAAIAAASIVAKVVRDRYMHRADQLYPGYGFAQHVGYITAEHQQAIRQLGVAPLHRLSYRCAVYAEIGLQWERS